MKSNQQIKMDVSLGLITKNKCPKPLQDLYAGYISNGILFLKGSVVLYFYNLYKNEIKTEKQKKGFIYFIQGENDNSNIKIGFSISLNKRIKTLQLYSPIKLRIIGILEGNIKLEKSIHKKFKKYRLWGEWFEANSEIFNFIEKKVKL